MPSGNPFFRAQSDPLTARRGNLDQERSGTLLSAAENLLTKAGDRLAAGQEAAARRLAERAAELPYDDFEEVHPALSWLALEAHMRLAEQVDDADEHDSGWIDRAEQVLPQLSDPGAALLRGALVAVLDEYVFTHKEVRRAHQLIGAEEHVAFYERDFGQDLVDILMDGLRALHLQNQLYIQALRDQIASREAETEALRAEIQATSARTSSAER